MDKYEVVKERIAQKICKTCRFYSVSKCHSLGAPCAEYTQRLRFLEEFLSEPDILIRSDDQSLPDVQLRANPKARKETQLDMLKANFVKVERKD